jgi:hypothetical protein
MWLSHVNDGPSFVRNRPSAIDIGSPGVSRFRGGTATSNCVINGFPGGRFPVLSELLKSRRMMVGADRLDLWKNLPHGFTAFEAMLERRRRWRRGVVRGRATTASRGHRRPQRFRQEAALLLGGQASLSV